MKFVSSIKNYLKGIDINFIKNDDNIYVAKADMIKFEETYKILIQRIIIEMKMF